jgi:excinuclease ABC subunit A
MNASTDIKTPPLHHDTPQPKTHIIVRGARMHNLKDVTVAFPRNKITVVTGLSGSGKSSLAFDTLYAEGQRRYVESLSSYARQFLGRLDKPDVDSIDGISPAIAIEQKVTSRSSRSTVGTSTEIYDYLKLLFARVGRTYSPESGQEVKRHRVGDVVNFVSSLPEETRYMVIAPVLQKAERTAQQQLELLQQQGFSRVRMNHEIVRIDTTLLASVNDTTPIELVLDRLSVDASPEHATRLADSVESAFFEGNGTCIIAFDTPDHADREFNNRFELDGIEFEEPSPNFFSFNNPVGACKRCEGFGSIIGIDDELVVPNTNLSIYEDAVVCWRGDRMSEWKDDLLRVAKSVDFPIHRKYRELTPEQLNFLWNGNRFFSGIHGFFNHLEEKSYKIQNRVMLSRYRGKTKCPDCKGTRLRKDASYVKIDGNSLLDLVVMPADQLLARIQNLQLDAHDMQVAQRLLVEIKNRLQYLNDVGLGYLTLNRLSNSLSGGESQRINLSTCLGSNLTGSMYILDEPSIGLHPRDTHRLIRVLKALRDLGNTVIVVEHDEEIMEAADYIVDMGPAAGVHGGAVVFAGRIDELPAAENSLTAQYLTGVQSIAVPQKTRSIKESITLVDATLNNLKGVTVNFPLHALCVVSGVSGSGKSTLVSDLLYHALMRALESPHAGIDDKYRLTGDVKKVKHVEYIDQNPIGKSSRSNPVTYVKAFDEIRNIYSSQQIAKVRGYKPAHFSFNVPGGRCETCAGEGEVTIEMQFMADIKLTCETCKGKRFQDEVLEVRYREKNIDDVLRMTVEEAIVFFGEDAKKADHKKLIQKLQPLEDVGLGYLTLGQSSSTLSGGEAQRIKLASFLARGERQDHTVFIFDEPTTGLHIHDVKKLLDAFYALLKQGHSLIIIEHNLDVIKCADWIIDIGPEGGEAGGQVVFEGRPEDLLKVKDSHTAFFLKKKMKPIHT